MYTVRDPFVSMCDATDREGHDPVQVGLRGLPGGLSILAGEVIVLIALTVWKGHNRELMVISTVIMTAGMWIGCLWHDC